MAIHVHNESCSKLLSSSHNKDNKLTPQRYYCKTSNDIRTVYHLPESKVGKLSGFSYQPQTGKAQRLKADVYRLQSKIRRVEKDHTLSKEERGKELRHLRCRLKYANCQLNNEIARTPTVSVIINSYDEVESSPQE